MKWVIVVNEFDIHVTVHRDIFL